MDSRKIILITGANTGLGYEVVRSLCDSEVAYELLLGARSLTKAEEAIKTVRNEFRNTPSELRPVQIDLEDDNSITAAFQLVSDAYGRIDTLINNGGTQLDNDESAASLTARQRWNKTYDVNVTGTHILTRCFAPLLLKSSDPRLLFMTSGMSSLKGTEDSGMPWNRGPGMGWPKAITPIDEPAYRCSKTALNMLMREWYRYLKDDGVKVWSISPGYLATGLGGSREKNVQRGALDPAIGGRFVRDVLVGRHDGDVGKVVHHTGVVQAW